MSGERKKIPNILLTGFGRFGEVKENPSELLCLELSNRFPQYITGLILPVSFNRSIETLKNKVNELSPEIIISLGVARGRDRLHFEVKAKNWMESSLCDIDGYHPQGEKIIEAGPEFLCSNFSPEISEIEKSEDAGGYVCNSLYYHALFNYGETAKVVFIHVPHFFIISQEQQVKILNQFITSLLMSI